MAVVSKYYGFIALTGGADGALDKLDGGTILNGSMAFGIVSGVLYFYTFNTSSSAAESVPNVIAPDTGSGRWLLNNSAIGKSIAMSIIFG